MTHMLYDANGRPVRSSKPVTDEIATISRDVDLFSGWLNRLENPDPVLRTESRGKGLKLYDEVDRDPHAGAVLQTRYLAVVGKEWEVIPADQPGKRGRRAKTDRNEEIARFVESALSACNFDQARSEMLQGILYGFYVVEVIWTKTDKGVVPGRLRAKHPRRFTFTANRELRLLTPENQVEGVPVPDRKFIVFTYGSSDNPYGCGLGRRLWWSVWFKKNSIKFWMIFSEKFGQPVTVGMYPAGTSEEDQQRLLDALDALQTDTGVKIPDTMKIAFLEAQRQGSINTYEGLCNYMDRQISKAVLGQTLTTEVGSTGSYAASQTHNEVRDDIVKADADLHCECLNQTLVRWIVDYNFPGVTAYPELWIRTEAEQDLKPLAERDKILVREIGVPVPESYFYDTYGLPRPEEGDAVIGAGPETKNENDAEFAEPGATDAAVRDDNGPARVLSLLGEKALSEAPVAALVEPVRELLNNCESLEEFRDRLIDVYGDMDVSELGTLLTQALVAADLAGRFDAVEC